MKIQTQDPNVKHNWFAWYPVKTRDHYWVWLQTVKRVYGAMNWIYSE